MDEISRRRFLAQAGLSAAGVVAAGVLAGCGSKSTSSTKISGPSLNDIKDPAARKAVSPLAFAGDLPKTTLHLAIEAGPEADAHTALAPEFKKYTKGRVEVIVEQQSRTGYNQKYLTLMQAKSPEWDVISFQNSNFGLYGPRGYLLPFTKYMADPSLFNAAAFNPDDYAPAVKDSISLKGDLYGFVQTVSASMLYYRKDLLKKYGGVTAPPTNGWSLDEVTAISKKMLKGMKADGLKTYPYFFMAGPDQAAVSLYSFAEFSGVPIMTEGLKPQFSDPKIQECINWTCSMQQQGLTPPGLGSDSYAQGITVLQNQQAAMGIQWDAAAATILDKKQSPDVYDKIGFARMPYSPTGGPAARRQYPSVWAVGVSSFSKNPEAAFAYCTWFCSPEVGESYITSGGGTTGRESLLSSPSVIAKAPWYTELGQTLKLLGSFPNTPAFPYINDTLMLQTASKIWGGNGSSPSSVKSDLEALDSAVESYLHQQGIKFS
jgi:ABC-type glycerol-3-phosphate transport system substrate-binding protein